MRPAPWPALWGVIVCVIAGLGVAVAALLQIQRATDHWQQVAAERRAEITYQVQTEFSRRLSALLEVAESVQGDLRQNRLLEPAADKLEAGIFDWLKQASDRTGFTIDLVDRNGVIRVWAGRSVRASYSELFGGEQGDTIAFLTRNGPQISLSVARRDSGGSAVVVSRLLESKFPISNRFIPSSSFSDEVSAVTGVRTSLEYESPPAASRDSSTFRLGLTAFRGRPLVTVIVEAVQMEDAILGIRQQMWTLLRVIGAVVAALVAWIGCGMTATRLRVLGQIALVWAVRFIWVWLGFPSAIVRGELFNPSVYGSPFGGGLVATPGDLLLSGIALLWTVLLIRSLDGYSLLRVIRRVRPGGARSSIAVFGVFLVSFVFVLFVRAFAAVLRSFVFDSSVVYQDATRILPDSSLGLMIVAIVLVAVAFYGMFRLFVDWIFQAAGECGIRQRMLRGILIIASIAAALGVLRWMEETLLWPSYMPFFVAAVAGLHRLWNRWRERGDERSDSTIPWKSAAVWLMGAYLVTAPVFYERVEERERTQIESLASELLRPADAWLTYLLSDGIRTTADLVRASDEENPFDPDAAGSSAFNLWARMLISREGYNSGVFVYDSAGREVDRFVVGIEPYDQRAILSKVFDYGEETVQTLERTAGRENLKLYGMWSTIRSGDGTVLGSVALFLAPGSGLIPGRVAANPLRASGGVPDWRDVYLTEYRDSIVTATSRPDLYEGVVLGARVRELLQGQPEFGHWVIERGEDRSYGTLYVRDPSDGRRVVAVSVESLDVRWYIFTVLKLFGAFVAVALLVALTSVGWSVVRGGRPAFTVGQKLFGGFAVIAVIPLVVLGYYNRSVSTDRVRASIEKSLRRDVEVVSRRIVTYVEDERDFVQGVTDEFCRAVASEYGTDFAVHRDDSLLASSRPELYRAPLFDRRLEGVAYAHSVLEGRGFYMASQTVGTVPYSVGYAPIELNGTRVGVVAVSTLYRQADIEREVAERNVYVVGVYGLVVLVALGAGGLLAMRLARPLQELSRAARKVGKGHFDFGLRYRGRDELGDLMSAFRDMTAELRQSREELTRTERERAWKEMAKQVAHEIRNPLTPIKLSVQHLRQAFQDKAPDREEILRRVTQTILEQIETLSRIALEFSHFARMPDARYERLEIRHLLEEAIAVFREVQGIEFRRQFSAAAADVLVDHDQMQRVFVNILRNSIQAMPQGGTITVDIAVDDHGCIVRLADNGPGIPPEIRSRIFEPNFSTKSEGMGLGLAIARKIVEDAGGRIVCESEVGRGTTFEIRLPRAGSQS